MQNTFMICRNEKNANKIQPYTYLKHFLEAYSVVKRITIYTVNWLSFVGE